MAKFKIYAKSVTNGDDKVLYYDNMDSSLTWEDGTPVKNTILDDIRSNNIQNDWSAAIATTPENPVGKSNYIDRLKIQMGLSCNYSCEYCSQRFVPHSDESNFKFVDKFINNLDLWLKNEPKNIEFWGGEPFVYIKTLKKLAEALRVKYPNSQFSVITNGSLLTYETNEWLEKMGFMVSISHDGPGQFVRGPDPLEDEKQREIIFDLVKRLKNKNMNVSFNSMIHRENMSRKKVQDYFMNISKEMGVEYTAIGEGGFIDSYDEGGVDNSLHNDHEHFTFRRTTIEELRRNFINGELNLFWIVQQRINNLLNAIAFNRPTNSYGQKCGMDEPNTIAVDLRGNVLTCQNVSSVSVAKNGNSHKIGHVSNMENVKLRTATHWSARKECSDCPVLASCQGSCMFLYEDLWKKACDSAYSDHIPFLAVVIELLTNYFPIRIENENLPENRKDIWGPNNVRYSLPKIREKARQLNDSMAPVD